MYTPRHFEAPDLAAMHALMRAHPLAALVTLSARGLDANHIPLLLLPAADGPGVLRGHVARANPLLQTPQTEDVLVIFQGPSAYVSPGWYPSKAENHRAVPTWNYLVVHAHGPLRLIEDQDWLRSQLATLTADHEAGAPTPWSMDEAPAEYIETLLKAIVGIEIPITRLQGKWKLSQNQPGPNRAGVIAAMTHLESLRPTDS
jgi:transcriptional regulator